MSAALSSQTPNPFETAARARKAAKLALAIERHLPGDVEKLATADPETRALVAKLAGVAVPSDRTWAEAIGMLRVPCRYPACSAPAAAPLDPSDLPWCRDHQREIYERRVAQAVRAFPTPDQRREWQRLSGLLASLRAEVA